LVVYFIKYVLEERKRKKREMPSIQHLNAGAGLCMAKKNLDHALLSSIY